MYTVIRRYQGDGAKLNDFARRVGDNAHDIITSIPGFVGYVIGNDGKGTMLTVGTYDDKAGAAESSKRAAAWVRANAADLSIAAPTIIEGTVRIRKSTAGVIGAWGVLRVFRVDPASVDEIAKRVEAGFAPIISAAPGFARYSTIDLGNGMVASTSSFLTQAQADASISLAADWVKKNLGALIPNPPEVTSMPITTSWSK
jgi:hypothetical protein